MLRHLSSTKRLVIGGALFVAGLLLGFYGFQEFSLGTSTQSTQKNSSSESVPLNQDELFASFVEVEIFKRCPYYLPDGLSYRSCLSDWEEELASKALPNSVDDARNYCAEYGEKNADAGSLAASELFLQCSIFVLQEQKKP